MDVIPLPSKSPKVVRVRFDGVVYRRYPEAKCSANRRYYRCGPGDAFRGRGWLHRDIWAHYHGPIPDGHDVHHRDGDPENNARDNLECLPADEHQRRHFEEASRRGRARVAAMPPEKRAAMLAAAAEWHRSPEGRAWHREHAMRLAVGLKPRRVACSRCGVEFETRKRGRTRFCGANCKAAARRASGVDNRPRACVGCGGEFVVNRYAPRRYCSRACSRTAIARRAGAGV